MPDFRGSPPALDPRRQWELEVLGLVLAKLGYAVLSFRSIRRELRGIRLEGQHPQTTILVTIFNPELGQSTEMRFALWDSLTEGLAGERRDPDDVASLIAINASEP
jgi:hypothetical protein